MLIYFLIFFKSIFLYVCKKHIMLSFGKFLAYYYLTAHANLKYNCTNIFKVNNLSQITFIRNNK